MLAESKPKDDTLLAFRSLTRNFQERFPKDFLMTFWTINFFLFFFFISVHYLKKSKLLRKGLAGVVRLDNFLSDPSNLFDFSNAQQIQTDQIISSLNKSSRKCTVCGSTEHDRRFHTQISRSPQPNLTSLSSVTATPTPLGTQTAPSTSSLQTPQLSVRSYYLAMEPNRSITSSPSETTPSFDTLKIEMSRNSKELERLSNLVRDTISRVEVIERDKLHSGLKAGNQALRELITWIPPGIGQTSFFETYVYWPPKGTQTETSAINTLLIRIVTITDATLASSLVVFQASEMQPALRKAAAKRLADLRLEIFKSLENSLSQLSAELQAASELDMMAFRELLEPAWMPLSMNIHTSRKHPRRDPPGVRWEFHARAFLILLRLQEEEATRVLQGPSDAVSPPSSFRLSDQSTEMFAFLTLRLSVSLAQCPPKVYANFSNWLQTYRLLPFMVAKYHSICPRWTDSCGRASINKTLFAIP